jgi:hypothetical protein
MASSAPPPPPRRDYYVAVSTPEARLPTIVELFQALIAPPEAPPNGVAPLAGVVACSTRDSLDAATRALRECGGCGTEAGSRDLSVVILHGDLSDRELEQRAAEFRARLAEGRRAATTEAVAVATASPAPPTTTTTTTTASAATAAAATAAALRPRSALLLIATDACLRALLRLGAAGGPPALLLTPEPAAAAVPATSSAPPPAADADSSARPSAPPPLLVQFDLPPTREAFVTRLSVAFGARSAGRKGSAAGGPPAPPPPPPVVVDFFSASEVPLFRARERFLPGGGPVEEMPVSVTDVFKDGG